MVAVVFGNRARGVLPDPWRASVLRRHDAGVRLSRRGRGARTRARYLRQYAFTGKTAATIQLDPDKRLLDIDRSNNGYEVGKPATLP